MRTVAQGSWKQAACSWSVWAAECPFSAVPSVLEERMLALHTLIAAGFCHLIHDKSSSVSDYLPFCCLNL